MPLRCANKKVCSASLTPKQANVLYVAHARHRVPRDALVCRLKKTKKRHKMLKKRRVALK